MLGLKNSNIYRKLNPIFITPLLRVVALTFKLESTPFFFLLTKVILEKYGNDLFTKVISSISKPAKPNPEATWMKYVPPMCRPAGPIPAGTVVFFN